VEVSFCKITLYILLTYLIYHFELRNLHNIQLNIVRQLKLGTYMPCHDLLQCRACRFCLAYLQLQTRFHIKMKLVNDISIYKLAT